MTIELSVAWARRFGEDVRTVEAFGLLTADVPAELWEEALLFARDELGCRFFDWLTAVDELDAGFSVVAHVHSLEQGHHLLVRTRVPRADPRLVTATGVYRGADWHERETFEMFGVVFDGHPDLRPLLLPDGFEGNPLRKEFVLAARVAKPWPGAKEPGESGQGAPSRRRMLPPGVPQDWGPAAREAPARPAPRRRPGGRGLPDTPDAGATAGEAHAARTADSPGPGGTPAHKDDANTARGGAADRPPPEEADVPGTVAPDEPSGTFTVDDAYAAAVADQASGTATADDARAASAVDEAAGEGDAERTGTANAVPDTAEPDRPSGAAAPSDESSGAAVTGERSGAAVTGEASGIPPADETSVTAPADETSATPSADESPATAPMDEASTEEAPGTPSTEEAPGTTSTDESPAAGATDDAPGTGAPEESQGAAPANEASTGAVPATGTSDEAAGAESDAGAGPRGSRKTSGTTGRGRKSGTSGSGTASGARDGGAQQRPRRRARGIDPEGEGGGDV